MFPKHTAVSILYKAPILKQFDLMTFSQTIKCFLQKSFKTGFEKRFNTLSDEKMKL